MATLGKPQRQHRLARLLEEQVISSQAQIVELLGTEGVLATQATVSRDLEELGAVKVRIPGGAMAYAVPEHSKDRAPPEEHLRRVMGDFVVEVSHSGNLVVLRTPPGSAHVIGSALDRAGFPDVLGNVSGDDTIIVVCAETAGGARGRGATRRAGRAVARESPERRRAWRRKRWEKPVNAKRVVLAYSGGLDTSVAVRWIQEEWGAEVVAMAVDVGQVPDADAAYWEAIRQRAFAAGAIEAQVVDARAEYAREYVARAIKANALYEGKYPLVSALSRPVIARHLVAAAREHGADAVAHGCTGKGNDQVRFEVSVRALAPDLDVLAPVRVWGFTRQDSIEYAARHNIPITVTEAQPYSIDENIVGRAIECGILEDPWVAPPEDVYALTRSVRDAPAEPREVVLQFDRGVPVALDGAVLPLHEILNELNPIVGSYGFGRLDMVENRRVGIKSRETYECPGMLALILAHADLESITLERDVAREKSRLEPRYSELVYDGLWFSPLREAFDAFIDSTQRHVTGEVRLRLEPGRCFAAGRRAERGLYDYALATYEADDAFRHEDAAGFVRLWGLSVETWSRRQRTEEPSVAPDDGTGSSR